MRIQDMFAKGIDRPINGVVKVNQDELDILVQELDEYVITRELKKHIITFFNNYLESFNALYQEDRCRNIHNVLVLLCK